MSNFPFYLVASLIVLGVLVVVHELGHYLAARYCGVKVLRFSVGFGKTIFQRKLGVDRTEWAIAHRSPEPAETWSVKMLDEREGEVAPEERHRAFNQQSVGKRSLIVAAGPLANFALAILLYWAIFMHGSEELLPILGDPPVNSPAAAAGIGNGERVRAVDGQVVATWDDFRWLLLQKAADQESVEIEVINEQREIGKVSSGGPAEMAGMRVGDHVVAINDVEIGTWIDFVRQVRDGGGKPLHLEINRNGQVVMVDVIPELISERGRQIGKVGVAVAETADSRRDLHTFISYGFFEAGVKAKAIAQSVWAPAI